MTAKDLLSLVSNAKHANEEDVAEYIDSFKLFEFVNTKFGAMSLGTQRKFTFIAALIGNPKLLLLDEPTNSLDQVACAKMSEILRCLAADRAVVLSTHSESLIREIDASVVCLDSAVEAGVIATN